MALDKNSSDRSYLIGRLVAIIQTANKQAPQRLPALVMVNPKEKLSYWFSETSKTIKNTQYEKDWLSIIDKFNGFPSKLNIFEQSRMWIGYYHQLSDIKKINNKL